jgi:anti-sigma regulatory factor (Ser/Thr protein kinase)
MEGVIATGAIATCSRLIDVDEQSQIGAARRAATAVGSECHLGADGVGRLALVVTEAATNIVRHAGRGLIILRVLAASPVPTVEVLALDKGPGINNLERAMRDGYSTAGTAGEGLGAMQRVADVFELHTQRDMGTAIVARIRQRSAVTNATRLAPSLEDQLGVISAPLRGQTACGDAWRIVEGHHRLAVLLVDGLGHGPDAAAAALIPVRLFAKLAGDSPENALAACDRAMRGTRGAAVSVAMIAMAERAIQFGGVGNVDGRVLTDGQKAEHLVPQNGIVGHTMPTVRSTAARWPVGARLVMHSDGIAPRWRIDAYEGLAGAHPALVAGIIFRDFARARDDATVLVLDDHPWGARR